MKVVRFKKVPYDYCRKVYLGLEHRDILKDRNRFVVFTLKEKQNYFWKEVKHSIGENAKMGIVEKAENTGVKILSSFIPIMVHIAPGMAKKPKANNNKVTWLTWI
jgi:hypothetical protein